MGVKGPTAKTILKRSIEDIEAGHWCQHTIGKRNGTTEACAVGLLSMHADYGVQKGKWFHPKYPDADAPGGVKKALEALHAALPRKCQATKADLVMAEDEEERISVLTSAITGYNDDHETTARKAATWFKKAMGATP